MIGHPLDAAPDQTFDPQDAHCLLCHALRNVTGAQVIAAALEPESLRLHSMLGHPSNTPKEQG